jgi:hypothetical protein
MLLKTNELQKTDREKKTGKSSPALHGLCLTLPFLASPNHQEISDACRAGGKA